MKVGDKITYTYIKRIKKWMECPVCHQKMTFKKTEKAWKCNSCSYFIPEADFLDDFSNPEMAALLMSLAKTMK